MIASRSISSRWSPSGAPCGEAGLTGGRTGGWAQLNVVRAYLAVRVQRDCALQDILQLSHIAGKGV